MKERQPNGQGDRQTDKRKKKERGEADRQKGRLTNRKSERDRHKQGGDKQADRQK